MDAELAVLPELTDLGVLIPGDRGTSELSIAVQRGGTVHVALIRVDGDDAFTVTAEPEFDVSPRDGPEAHTVQVTYAPLDEALNYARIGISNNSLVPDRGVDVRGRAAWPDVDVVPPALDLGAATAGIPVERTLTLRNEGVVDLTELAVTSSDAAVTAAPPESGARAGELASLTVVWTPADDAPLHGTLTLLGRGWGPVEVPLWGNAPETALWVDADGDGIAAEAGDCDDGDPTVNPEATDVANGVDDDCDGDVDENGLDLDRDGATDNDCDDQDPWASPDLPEWPDGVDNDCNGEVDDLPGIGGPSGGPPCGHSPAPPAALPACLALLLTRRRASDRP